MSRPRSEDRRNATLEAATHVIASQGLSAPTALIAKRAGVSNGSLFLYFETKAVLLNELYVQLKIEMNEAALGDLPVGGAPREQMLHMWMGWLGWATSFPDKRRAIAQLGVSDEITPESHELIASSAAGIAVMLRRSLDGGPMQDAPLGFVMSLLNAIAEATIDVMIREPAAASSHSGIGFDALWRVMAGAADPAPTDAHEASEKHQASTKHQTNTKKETQR